MLTNRVIERICADMVAAMSATPVVLVAFNRPDLTRRTLDAIRGAQPDQLFLVADGPREDRPGEEVLCREVRDELERVDWPCKVERRFSDVNLGCEANVELGLDWVFSQVDEAVILEDDCIPDPTFFRYCDELLVRYATDERIWHIAGNSHWVPTELFTGDSYAFSTYASVWGWATWARAWHAHRAVFPRDHSDATPEVKTGAPVRTTSATPKPGALVTPAARRHYAAVAGSAADQYGWDSHWWLTIMSKGGLSVTPSVNIVANDGFGEGATHTRSSRPVTPSEPIHFPLRHPEVVALRESIERELELVLLRANGRLARAARAVIRPLWLRGIVRRLVSNPVVWRWVRKASQAASRVRQVMGRFEPRRH